MALGFCCILRRLILTLIPFICIVTLATDILFGRTYALMRTPFHQIVIFSMSEVFF